MLSLWLVALPATAAADARASVTLHERLQAYEAFGLNLVYSRQQVQGIRIVVAPLDPSRALADQLRVDLADTGLTVRLIGNTTGYLVASQPAAGHEATPAVPTGAATVPATVMEEIIVTSPRLRLTRNRFGGSSVPAAELEVYPVPARDVLRAVGSLPGNSPTGTGARQHTRGGDTDEVLYMLDGVRLIEPFHLADFEALFSTLNPAVVGQVDVYSAGFPVDQGSRLAGVVDVSLLEPEEALEGEVDLNLLTAAAAAGGHVSAGDSGRRWLVSARRSTIDLFLDSAKHDYGKPMFNDVLLHGSMDSDRGRLAVGVLSTNDELDLRDALTGESARADFHARSVWAKGAWSPGARSSLDTHLLWTEIENEREGVLDQPLDAVGSLDESRRFSFLQGSATLSMTLGADWLLRTGVEAGHQRGRFDLDLAVVYGPLALPLQAVPGQVRQVVGRRRGDVYGAFVSVARTVTEGFDVEFGLRQDFQDIDPVHAHVTSPRLQLNWHDDRWSVFLHAGRYAQLQELQDIDLDDGQFELAPVQKLDHLSVGLTWEGVRDWSAGIDLWCRLSRSPVPRFENVYNRLVLLPELHADRVRFAADRSRACGLDSRLEWNLSPETTLRASWSRAFTEERIDGRWQDRPWDVRHLLRFSLGHETAKWNLRIGTTWHSGWPRTALIEPGGPVRFDDRRYRPYFSVDLHAGRLFTAGRSSVELYLDAGNALDRENPAGTVFRQVPGGFESRSRQLLPIVPNAGVRVIW